MDLEYLLLDWLEPSQVASSKNRFPTRASEDEPVCFCCFEIGSHYVALAALMFPVWTRVTSNLQYSYGFSWDYRQVPCLASHCAF